MVDRLSCRHPWRPDVACAPAALVTLVGMLLADMGRRAVRRHGDPLPSRSEDSLGTWLPELVRCRRTSL